LWSSGFSYVVLHIAAILNLHARIGAKMLGPQARRLICTDQWTDHYPARESFAKELDMLLQFAKEQNCLPIFKPKLEARRNTQRDEALNELRIAYLLHHGGFPIVQWEPPGLNGKVGEYLVGTLEARNVFVEVKSPGWEGELSEEERRAGRGRQPKYRRAENFAVGNWKSLQKCIASEKTYPKFTPSQPSLLVVADDFKFSLNDSLNQVEIALYAGHKGYGELGYFTSARFENLGAVGIFEASSAGREVEYEFQVFANPFALHDTKVPDSLLKFKVQSQNRWS
jgi:hypothetical protein